MTRRRGWLSSRTIVIIFLGTVSCYFTLPLTTLQAASLVAFQSPVLHAPENPTAADFERARRELEAATSGLQRIEILLTAVSVALILFGIGAALFGYFVIRNWAEARARQTARSEMAKSIAQVFSSLSYIEWARAAGQDGLALAIDLGERALSRAEEAGDETRIAIARTNLAYYYAEARRADRKEVALEYAREARAKYPKVKRESHIANDIFVRTRYADDCDEETLRPLKREAEDLIRRFPQIAGELQEYIDEMVRKCPALGGAPSRLLKKQVSPRE